MTNNTYPDPRPEMTRRELREHHDHWRSAPAGSHYANALAFIIDSLAEGDAESTGDLRMMDTESLLEFGEMYNFTEESFRDALTKFEQAYLAEEKIMRDR